VLFACGFQLPRWTDISWQGFSYGLLDTLNKHFQNTLGITRARSAGLQAAYFG
jgi:fucose permease